MRSALDELAQRGVNVPLVVFGHMHHVLRGSGYRNMVQVDDATGTVFLNAAVVPRVRNGGVANSSKHHFLLVDVVEGEVESARNLWVEVSSAPQAVTAAGGSAAPVVAGPAAVATAGKGSGGAATAQTAADVTAAHGEPVSSGRVQQPDSSQQSTSRPGVDGGGDYKDAYRVVNSRMTNSSGAGGAWTSSHSAEGSEPRSNMGQANSAGSRGGAAAASSRDGSIKQGTSRHAAPVASSSNGSQGRLPDAFHHHRFRVVDEQPLLRTTRGDNGTVKMIWDAHLEKWMPVVLKLRSSATQPVEAAAESLAGTAR